MSKKEIRVGDVFTADFIRNRKGGKPICRLDGIVGFISDNEVTFCAPGSTWIVEVCKVNNHCVEVTLIEEVRTPKENDLLLRQKLKEIAKQESLKHEMLNKRRN